MTARLSDRIAGTILLALAIWFFVQAGSYNVAFGDPAGPSLFPRAVAVPVGLLAVVLILRPDRDPMWFRWPNVGSQAATVVILFAYPALIEPVGFPLSTALAAALLARILGGGWLQSVLSGLLIGFGLFFMFDDGFGLPLPVGPIFG